MSTTVEAINALIALTTLMTHAAGAAQRVGEMIRQAQSEGRDLTQTEIDQIRSARHDALERLRSLG